MTLSAFLGRCVGIKSVGTSCQTTAVAVEVKEVGSTRGGIETLFGVVLTGSTFGAALLTKIKNVGVNELTSGTGGTASIGSNVFVVRCFGCGGYTCNWISGSYCDVLARLTLIKTRVSTSETARSAFRTRTVYCFFIIIRQTILNAFIAFQK
jgi:hypothetical protein